VVLWIAHAGHLPTHGGRRDGAAGSAGPQLQSAPQPDLAHYQAEKQRELDATGPIAGDPGYARIPIGRAMALVSEGAWQGRNAAAEKRP